MNDRRTLLVFFGMCVGWALVHLYLYRRHARSLSSGARRAFAVATALGASLAPASMVLARTELDSSLQLAFSRLAFYEAGLVAIVVVFTIASDLVSLAARALGAVGAKAPDPDRRRFIRKVTDVGVLSFSAMIAGTGALAAYRAPEVVRRRVEIRGLPAELEGYRIVQISDVHVGPAYRREGMEALVRAVGALDADLVAVTGDLVDGTVAELADHVAPLGGLSAPDGVLFVTGNHEYYWDAIAWTEHLRGLGLRTLDNEHVIVERGGARLLVAGCTDHRMGASIAGQASSPRAALEGAPACHARVLLAHQPRSVFEAAEAGYDLQLSGHTHGGQFFPFTALVHLVQPFVRGLSRHEGTQIYVNRGTGFWGPALRHGGPGEITVLTLHGEPGAAVA